MIYLYNTLSRKKDTFKPIGKTVGLYTCGPTVYNYAHLGNLRTYVFEDLLKRVLFYNGFKVKHVMNITDVGHLTGDRDMGEDKLEAGAKREGKSAWAIAKFYEAAFKQDAAALNISEPDIWCKATDNIKEQIALIKQLEKKGFTYRTSDGIYFNTAKVKNYNKLSHLPLAKLKEGARVEKNKEKKNPTDFALWKFSHKQGRSFDSAQDDASARRQMEWASPWGKGFPGWHIECSAMSLKYLPNNLDIHCGGIDHINIHHTNEIAQSEAATGKKFFNYWLHGAFLNIAGGKKMAKSANNFLTLDNSLIKKNINPLAFRFACLQTHYRKPMEYSQQIIKNAQQGLEHLYNQFRELQVPDSRFQIPDSKFQKKFLAAINNDLNTPKALAVVQEVFRSKLPDKEKLVTVLDFDKVLGLDLATALKETKVPAAVAKLVQERETARQNKDWAKADDLRHKIAAAGYLIEDGPDGARLSKK
jgi:cysteinyl-tRNA synthetase